LNERLHTRGAGPVKGPAPRVYNGLFLWRFALLGFQLLLGLEHVAAFAGGVLDDAAPAGKDLDALAAGGAGALLRYDSYQHCLPYNISASV